MKRVLQREPLNLSALTTIGNAYVAIGNEDEAVRYYEQALQITEDQELKSTIRNKLNELKN
jgi:predicted negative regulator of RcsB-dependent stress response